MAKTPNGCVKHQEDYSPKAWEAYSLEELGNWVHLFAKRAQHRSNFAKKDKDLHDAQNYLDMMQSILNDLKEIRLEKLTGAFIRELKEINKFEINEGTPDRITIAYISFVVPDNEMVTGYQQFWEMFVQPTAFAMGRGLMQIKSPIKLVRLPMRSKNDPPGCSVFVCDEFPIRGTTSYDSQKGTQYSIEIAFADDGEDSLTYEEFTEIYAHKAKL